MAINAKVLNHRHAQSKPFPKLMSCASTGVVILAISATKGNTYLQGAVIVPGNSSWKTGEKSCHFPYNIFSDFDGEVTLSNK